MKGPKTFAGVDTQQTSGEDVCRQIFRVLKVDARVRVNSRVFMKKRALRKYLADSELAEVVCGGGEARRLAVHAKAWQGAG